VLCPKHCGALCPLPTNGMLFVSLVYSKLITPSRASLCAVSKMSGKHFSGRGVLVESCSNWPRRTKEGGCSSRHRFVVRRNLRRASNKICVADHSYALKLTSNLIPLLTSAGLSNASHPLLALLRLQHLLLSISLSRLSTQSGSNEELQKVLDDAIRTAVKVSSGLCEVLPEGHPIRGLHLAETGKLLAVDEFASVPGSNSQGSFPPTGAARLNLAFRNLVEARKELLIGFGQENGGGEVGEEVRKLVISVETEIGIWKDGVRTAWEEQGWQIVLSSGSSSELTWNEEMIN
jgi:hypothetical protein